MWFKKQPLLNTMPYIKEYRRKPSTREAVSIIGNDILMPDGLPEAVDTRDKFIAFMNSYDVLVKARQERADEIRNKFNLLVSEGMEHSSDNVL